MTATDFTVDIGGPVHGVDHGGDGPPLLLVHGLGGSHLDWMAVAPPLARSHHTVAIDLIGFGRTPMAGRRPTVRANRELVDAFIRDRFHEPVILVGNSMGGLISYLQAGLAPETVRALVLVDPALPQLGGGALSFAFAAAFVVFAVPGIGDGYMRYRSSRLGAERLVRETMALICADPSRVSADVMEAHIELTRQREQDPSSHAAFLTAARSIVGVLSNRWAVRRLLRGISAPTLMLHGDTDRLVTLKSAQTTHALRPDWSMAVFEGVGHVPMMEVPQRFLDTVLPWLAEH